MRHGKVSRIRRSTYGPARTPFPSHYRGRARSPDGAAGGDVGMDAPDQKVVTLASMRQPSATAGESVEAGRAGAPEAEVDRALYGRVVRQLQEATDEVGASDVLVTAPDREV